MPSESELKASMKWASRSRHIDVLLQFFCAERSCALNTVRPWIGNSTRHRFEMKPLAILIGEASD